MPASLPAVRSLWHFCCNSSLTQECQAPLAAGGVTGADLHLHAARPARKDAAAGCRCSCAYAQHLKIVPQANQATV